MSGTYELRPLTFGELLDRGFALYRRELGLLVAIHALIALVPTILVHWYRTPYFQLVGPLDSLVHSIPTILLACLLQLAGVLAFGVTTRALAARLLGEPLDLRTAFARTLPRFGDLIGLWLVQLVALMAGLVLCTVPTWVCAAHWYVATPVLVLEDLDPLAALTRSWQLVRGRAWRALGLLVATAGAIYALTSGVTLPFVLIRMLAHPAGALGHVLGQLSRATSSVASLVLVPLGYVMALLFYYDLRVRREAFDIERLLDATGPAPAAGSTPGPASPADRPGA